jgi:hypothetical protein
LLLPKNERRVKKIINKIKRIVGEIDRAADPLSKQ